MGQRHQIFIKSFNGLKEENKTTVGFHHQWLYGATAIRQLRNMLEFNKNTDKYHKLSSPKSNLLTDKDITKIVDVCFSTDIPSGYFYNMIELVNEEGCEYDVLSPENQDNNDGQTFVDFTDDTIKYCFTFPFDRDEDLEEGLPAIKCWKPLSASDYIKQYYNIEDTEQDEGTMEFYQEIKDNIKWIEDNCELMSQDDFFALYPYLKK